MILEVNHLHSKTVQQFWLLCSITASKVMRNKLDNHFGVVQKNTYQLLNGPRREKICLRGFANNTGADQPAHPRSLIRAFVIRVFESTISKLATSEISAF